PCRPDGPCGAGRSPGVARPLSERTDMDSLQVYDNPLVTRYAGREMAELWGPRRKFATWRRLWLALAEAGPELGLTREDGCTPRITPAQLEEMRQHQGDIDFARAAELERRK